jgi:hypothetical protein
MTLLTFLDGNGDPRNFDFNENPAGVFRFKIENTENFSVDISQAQETLNLGDLESTPLGIGDKSLLNYSIESQNVTTSLSFNFRISNDGGGTYRDFLNNDITWSNDRQEFFKLDNKKGGFTNIFVILRTPVDVGASLIIKPSII